MEDASAIGQIIDFCNGGVEKERLQTGLGKIEFERTQRIIKRYLQSAKQVIYDIGGGTGTYSRWLAEMGHEVHMFELASKAVEYAIDRQKNSDYAIISNPIFRVHEDVTVRCRKVSEVLILYKRH